jgi:hypothetical protein
LTLLFGFVLLACSAQGRPSEDKDHPKQDSKQPQDKPEQQAKPEQHAQQPRPSARQEQPARQQQAKPEHAQQSRPSTRNEQPARQQAEASPRRTQPQQRQAPQRQNPTVSTQQEHSRQQRTPVRAQQSRSQQHVQQAAWQQHRAGNWQSDHRTWQQRGGYNGYRIPDNRFRSNFGPDHGFRIEGLPFLVVGGYPRFQYEGYWLSVVDPWPANWGDDWYNNDQVYVSYVDNGYYLYNRSYPGVGIAVSISM